MFCSVAFIRMVTLQSFIHGIKSWNNLVQHNKQYHRKLLKNSFSLTVYNSGFQPRTLKLELYVAQQNSKHHRPGKYCSVTFSSGYCFMTVTDSNVRTTLYSI